MRVGEVKLYSVFREVVQAFVGSHRQLIVMTNYLGHVLNQFSTLIKLNWVILSCARSIDRFPYLLQNQRGVMLLMNCAGTWIHMDHSRLWDECRGSWLSARLWNRSINLKSLSLVMISAEPQVRQWEHSDPIWSSGRTNWDWTLISISGSMGWSDRRRKRTELETYPTIDKPAWKRSTWHSHSLTGFACNHFNLMWVLFDLPTEELGQWPTTSPLMEQPGPSDEH